MVTWLSLAWKPANANKVYQPIKSLQEEYRVFFFLVSLEAWEPSRALHRALLAAFSGANKIVGFSAKGFSLFFDHRVKERTDIHQADAYLEVLREIDISNFKHNGLEMWVDKHSQET